MLQIYKKYYINIKNVTKLSEMLQIYKKYYKNI